MISQPRNAARGSRDDTYDTAEKKAPHANENGLLLYHGLNHAYSPITTITIPITITRAGPVRRTYS